MNRILRITSLILGAVLFSAPALIAQSIPECTADESWLPIPLGGPDVPGRARSFDDGLYVIGYGATTDSQVLRRYGNNGWTQISEFNPGVIPIVSLSSFRGKPVISGLFDNVDGAPGTRGLAIWNGAAWESVGGNVSPSQVMLVNAVEEHNGDLYCAYSIDSTTLTYHVARFDGASWTELPAGAYARGIAGLRSLNGTLYAFGRYNVNPESVVEWDGSDWTAVGQPIKYQILDMVAAGRRIYAYGNWLAPTPASTISPLIWFDGASWRTTDLPFGKLVAFGNVASHNSQIYMQGTYHDTIAGRDSANLFLGRYDGSAWHPVSRFDQSVTQIVEHAGALHAIGLFRSSCGTGMRHYAVMCDGACGTVSGSVYADLDGNCVRDPKDPGLAGRLVAIGTAGIMAITDINGDYVRRVLPGDYTVSLVPYRHWVGSCVDPPAPYNVRVNAPGDIVAGNDFATRAVPNVHDIRVSIVSGRARPGVATSALIRVFNVGTTEYPVTIRAEVDLLFGPTRITPTPTRMAGNVLEWDLPLVSIGTPTTITIDGVVGAQAVLGRQFCNRVRCLDPADADLSDNSDESCVEITNSYDPNDIAVAPLGEEEQGGMIVGDSVLTYTIRFQNTGNDTAFRVVVVDTLPSTVDLSSLVLGAVSHPFTLGIGPGNALVWTFDDIMLPDSARDQLKSNGFLKFSVRANLSSAHETRVENRASIYFDANAAVVTNTVVSVLAPRTTSSVPRGNNDPAAMNAAVTLSPNPARDRVRLEGEMPPGTIVEVRDMLGRTRGEYRTVEGRAAMLDLKGLAAGSYLVVVHASLRQVVLPLVVVR